MVEGEWSHGGGGVVTWWRGSGHMGKGSGHMGEGEWSHGGGEEPGSGVDRDCQCLV